MVEVPILDPVNPAQPRGLASLRSGAVTSPPAHFLGVFLCLRRFVLGYAANVTAKKAVVSLENDRSAKDAE